MKRNALSLTVTSLVLVAVAAVWALPTWWALATSFKGAADLAHGIASLWPAHPTLANFVEAWRSAPFARYYLNTILVVLGILAFQLVSISLAAYPLARISFPGRNALFLLILAQLMIPPVMLILPNFVTMRHLHLVNTLWGVMLPYFASAYGIFLVRQAYRQVPAEFEDAARLDGANTLQVIRHVYVPLSRPSLLAFGVVSVTYHWNEFLWPLIVTNTPDKRTLTVGLASFVQSSESGAQWNLLAAGTVLVALPMILAFLVFQRRFIEAFTRSGFK